MKRKIIFGLIFLSIFSFFVIGTKAQTDIQEDMDAGFISQDNNVSCLLPTADQPKGSNINNLQTIPITLTGSCNALEGCDLIVENSTNWAAEKIIDTAQNPRCPSGGKINQKTGELITQDECLAMAENAMDLIGEEEFQVDPGQGVFNGEIAYNPGGSGPGTGYQLAYGPVDITIQQDALRHVHYSYYASGPPNVTEMGAGGEEENTTVTDENNSQQLAEINSYAFPTGGEVQEGVEQKCIPIGWDPYGRIFDAVSLEPMSNIRVTMPNYTPLSSLRKNYGDSDVRGVYNIIIDKAGIYTLDVQTPATHLFTDKPKLSSNYSLIYSDLYYPLATFEEKEGQITHHDIPLQPAGEPYREAVAEPIAGSFQSVVVGAKIVFKGRVTFPYAKVCLISNGNNKNIICGQADKRGEYNFAVAKTRIPQDEAIIVTVTKVDLTKISKSIEQEKTVVLGSDYLPMPENNIDDFKYQPILKHVEGYIYDRQGKIVPQGKVKVKLSMNNKLIYSTYADDSGFFTIYARNLPIFEYYLEFTDSNKVITKLTTSEFVKKNESYLDSEKLNLMVARKNNQPIVNPSTGKFNEKSLIKNPISNKAPSGASKISLASPTVIIAVIILLLVGAVVSLAFYIKKSKSY